MSTPAATVYRWDDLKEDMPMDLLTRKRIIGEKMMISRVHLRKGCIVPTHAHANEQMGVILSGALRFGVGADGPGQKFQEVRAGEVIHLPSNLPHSAEAIEDTIVLDVFSPPSATTGIDQPRR